MPEIASERHLSQKVLYVKCRRTIESACLVWYWFVNGLRGFGNWCHLHVWNMLWQVLKWKSCPSWTLSRKALNHHQSQWRDPEQEVLSNRQGNYWHYVLVVEVIGTHIRSLRGYFLFIGLHHGALLGFVSHATLHIFEVAVLRASKGCHTGSQVSLILLYSSVGCWDETRFVL